MFCFPAFCGGNDSVLSLNQGIFINFYYTTQPQLVLCFPANKYWLFACLDLQGGRKLTRSQPVSSNEQYLQNLTNTIIWHFFIVLGNFVVSDILGVIKQQIFSF